MNTPLRHHFRALRETQGRNQYEIAAATGAAPLADTAVSTP
jgi:hypothetical protein